MGQRQPRSSTVVWMPACASRNAEIAPPKPDPMTTAWVKAGGRDTGANNSGTWVRYFSSGVAAEASRMGGYSAAAAPVAALAFQKARRFIVFVIRWSV